jgi:hypothetical protein
MPTTTDQRTTSNTVTDGRGENCWHANTTDQTEHCMDHSPLPRGNVDDCATTAVGAVMILGR